LVVINDDSKKERTVSINIEDLKPILTLRAYRTSASENSADLGRVSLVGNSFTYRLPQESITTFTGAFQNP
jgi:hypothetical protein